MVRTAVVPAALVGALALALTGCGSSGSTASSSTPGAAAAPTLPPSGKYIATLTTSGLAAVGVDTANVGGGGVWHLAIGPRKMTLTPPPPEENSTTYPVVSVTQNRLTLGGERACSVYSGQTEKSVYTISTSPEGLQFVAVKVACKEDGGALTVGRWTKP